MSKKQPEKNKTARDKTITITITLGADGRVLFHDLTADFLPVAQAVCPQDRALAKRCQIARTMGNQ